MPSASIRTAFHQYAADGWAVFPAHGIQNGRCSCGTDCGDSAGKHPATKNGHNDATASMHEVQLWMAHAGDEARNIGLAIPPGYCVIDIDPRSGGDATLAALEAQHGKVPFTRVQVSGSSPPGAHLWYKLPPGRRLPSKLGQGVDVKQAGGYVIGAPSVHVSGREYEWIDPQAAIADAPPWIVARGWTVGDGEELEAADDGAPEALSPEEQTALVDALAPHWVLGQRHDLGKAVGGWLRQRGAAAADVSAVVGKLPSNNPVARVAAALNCYRASVANGWQSLCSIVGESAAREIDSRTPNPNRRDVEQWEDAAEQLDLGLAAPATSLEGVAPIETTDPYWGLPPPVTPDLQLLPPERIVDGLDIISGMPCALIGRPFAAKTPFAISLGLSVANGRAFLGRQTKPRRVLYCCYEKVRGAERKRVRMARAMGVDPGSLELLPWATHPLTKPGVVERIAAIVITSITAGQPPPLVIVDTYSAACLGTEHTSAEYAEPVSKLAHHICTKAGASLLVLLHARKGTEAPDLQDAEGHTAIAGAFDAAIALHRPSAEVPTQISVSCARSAEDGWPSFTIQFHDIDEPSDDLAGQIAADPKWGLSAEPCGDGDGDGDGDKEPGPGIRRTEAENRLIAAMDRIRAALMAGDLDDGGTTSRADLERAARESRHVTERALRALVIDGAVERLHVKKGGAYRYRLIGKEVA